MRADSPTVTVLMSVHNAERYVSSSIKSILSQTFRDFEFLIFEDASTDNSLQAIKEICDPRIKLIENSEQMGLSANLNRGLKLARGEYIARMDADDISLVDRLARQVAFMQENPDVGVCGSAAIEVDDADRTIRVRKVRSGKCLERWVWMPSPLIHPTVMFKKKIAQQFSYDVAFIAAQDYELWLRMYSAGVTIDNVSEILLRYRVHGENASSSKRTIQLQASYSAFKKTYPRLALTYREFLSLIAETHEMNPLQRHRNLRQIMGGGWVSMDLIKNFSRYAFLWAKRRGQLLASRLAGKS